MLNKSIKLLFTILLLGSIINVSAQERVPFDSGKSYILADIEVIGKTTFNEQTIVIYTGLQKGKSITVPGEEISDAVKKLGKLQQFNEINFYIKDVVNDSIYLQLYVEELPKLSEAKIVGIKKGKAESLIKETDLKKGKIVNENFLTTTKNFIENKYKKDGFYKAKAHINTIPDTTDGHNVKMLVTIDRGEKVKIRKINITGNEQFSDKSLRKAMSNTKVQNPIRIFKKSKFIKEKYEEDLESILNKYKSKGYRDARITSDTVYMNEEKNKLEIAINVEEGNKYYFGNIKFLGNSVYSDRVLSDILGIKKGEVYNGVLLEERIANPKKPDGEDLTNLYQNSGYLFSKVTPVEVKTSNDTIDFEIRIIEGPVAYFNKITVKGNDKTNDEIIYRELRTRPGQRYSKDAMMQTVRELGTIGFFDPEAINPEIKNVDPSTGNIDVEWTVAEKGSSQIELQGGYGGGGFIGTLGLSFNNFSLKNIFNKEAYQPLPMGDGQKVSLRLQGSSYFQTYSLSFMEPWFGGKKPVSFSTAFSYSKQYSNSFYSNSVDKSRYFNIISFSLGLNKRLSEPDDSFYLSQTISMQYYDLNNYNTGLFTFGNGNSKNLSYTIGLKRDNRGNSLIFPMYGSQFSLTGKFTPPYSLWNKVDYKNLENEEEYKIKYEQGMLLSDSHGVLKGDYLKLDGYNSNGAPIYSKVDTYQEASADQAKVDQKKFNWLEYYKIKMSGETFTKIYDKLVLRSLFEFGFLGNYNSDRGDVPFERFFLGGDGLANFTMDGREVIQLRGYENQALTPYDKNGSQNGSIIYNKFSLELRYPLTLNPNASIYALAFFDAGSAYESFKTYNPFDLHRSAGFGLRVFMPAFGLLGIDFGHGFDAAPGATQKSGWQTHFIIGQQF